MRKVDLFGKKSHFYFPGADPIQNKTVPSNLQISESP